MLKDIVVTEQSIYREKEIPEWQAKPVLWWVVFSVIYIVCDSLDFYGFSLNKNAGVSGEQYPEILRFSFGIMLAAFAILRYRAWPFTILVTVILHYIIAAIFNVANATTPTMTFYLGSLIQAAVAGLASHMFLEGAPKFDHWRSWIGYILIYILMAPTVAGAFAVIAEQAFDTRFFTSFAETAMLAIATHAAITPSIFVVLDEYYKKDSRPAGRILEGILIFPILIILNLIAFVGVKSDSIFAPVSIYLPLPILVWSVVRFGITGASFSLLTTCIVAVVGFNNKLGPFYSLSPNVPLGISIVSAQLFLLIVALIVYGFNSILYQLITIEASTITLESRYRLLFERMMQGVLYLRNSGQITDANPAAERIFGISHDELLNRNINDKNWAAVREDESPFPVWEYPSNIAVRTGKPASATMGMYNPRENSYRWVSVDAVPEFRHGDDHPRELFLTVNDITLVKNATDALQMEEETYRALSESSPDSIIHVDKKCIIKRANQRSALAHGYRNVDEIVQANLSVTSMVADKDKERLSTFIQTIFDKCFQKSDVFTAKRKDGSTYQVEINGAPVLNDTGLPEVVVLIERDITERMRTDQVMKEGEERHRLIVNSVSEIIIVFDYDGVFRFLNKQAAQTLGGEVPDFIGRTMFDIFPPDVAKYQLDNARGVIDSGVSITQDDATSIRGEIIWWQVTMSPLTYEGRKAALFLAMDITGRKQEEEARINFEQKMRSSQRIEAIGRLAGGVAHDLNNLLSPMIGYTELALVQMQQDNPLLPILNQALQAAEKARQLTRQLLAYGRKQVLEVKALSMVSLVDDFSMILRSMVGGKIELITRMSPDLCVVKADPSQMQQVVMNFVVNARDAMADGGVITMIVDECDITEAEIENWSDLKASRYVRLMVTDTGCGMNDETIQHIFEPFFTTKAPNKGTGLGLATVYGIVKQHGGDIKVTSAVGKGTTFTVLLPAVEGFVEITSATGETTSLSNVPIKTTSVLVVEDNDLVRALAVDILKARGFEVFSTLDPLEAIDIFRTNEDKINLLITDIVMPKLNGRELAQRLLTIKPELNVIYVSGYSENVIATEGMLAQGTHFVQKPFTMSSLLQKVIDVLSVKE